MNGFLVVDKPPGISSHTVVSRIRRITGQKKAGHTGTLDPFATGVLPIALGDATKAIQFLDESMKEYRAVMRIGQITDTQDCTGTLLEEHAWQQVTDDDILRAAALFLGPQKQLPPMYSAIKQNGVPLYRLARQGSDVPRELRDITIHSIRVEQISLPEITLLVSCSRGTYVRTLAHDIGRHLGCGAHLVSLRRTRSGPFSIDTALALEQVALNVEANEPGSWLMSVPSALGEMHELQLSDSGARKVLNGVIPAIGEFLPTCLPVDCERVMLMHGERLLAVARCFLSEGTSTLRLLRVFT
ncbi:MAG: tRNA pseudouridine(55) synthase TruB [Geobacter sp.]|nr:tRNA pseudouridine(55) synthase TruB [Geobacter sp.]